MARLNYKIMFIASEVVWVEDIIRRLEEIINTQDGYVLNIKRSGNRRLAYAIKNEERGNFVRIEFMAVPKVIRVLDKVMEGASCILWHKFIRVTGLEFGSKSDYQCY